MSHSTKDFSQLEMIKTIFLRKTVVGHLITKFFAWMFAYVICTIFVAITSTIWISPKWFFYGIWHVCEKKNFWVTQACGCIRYHVRYAVRKQVITAYPTSKIVIISRAMLRYRKAVHAKHCNSGAPRQRGRSNVYTCHKHTWMKYLFI